MIQISKEKWNRISWLQTEQTGDELAFQRAVRLCRDAEADLNILKTEEEVSDHLYSLIHSLGLSLPSRWDARAQGELIERTKELAASEQVAVEHHTIHGRPLEGIVRHLISTDCDLLVKAAQPSFGIRRVLLGHLDRQLIRKCPCPVWIEKPDARPSHDRILAAVDPAPFADDLQHHQLNVDILQWASYLADVEQAQLDIVHVWPFHHERRLLGRGGFSDRDVARIGAEIRSKHQDALDNLIEPFRSKIHRIHLLKGDAAEEISRLADQMSFDVVVLGTVCRTGIQGLLIGNTAETVLDQINCSVMALKPRGFVSPIATD